MAVQADWRPVETFVSAAARDTAMPTPRIGQGVFLLDSGSVLFYYGAHIGWRPPWNTAWGEIATAALPGNSSTLPAYDGAPVDNLSLSPSLLANRQYECIFDGLATSTVDNEIVVVTVHAQNGTVTHTDWAGAYPDPTLVFSQAFFVVMTSSAAIAARYSTRFTWSPDVGVPFFFVTGSNLTGFGNAQLTANKNGQTKLRIIDLGPAGNPVTS